MTDDAHVDAETRAVDANSAGVKPAEVETAKPEPGDAEAETDQGEQLSHVDYVTGSMARGIDETYKELERLPD
jgi:hypothetical protein